MSQHADRLRQQGEFEQDAQSDMQKRPPEPTARTVPDPRSWASTCAGWRVGIHERTKENRLAGIYQCKWCAQTFHPPTSEELAMMRQRNLVYQRPQQMRRARS